MNDNKISKEAEGVTEDNLASSVEKSTNPQKDKQQGIMRSNRLKYGLALVLVIVLIVFVLVYISRGSASLNPKESGEQGAIQDATAKQSKGWAMIEGAKYKSGDEILLTAYVDSQGNELGAFSFDLEFDQNMATLVRNKGAEGLEKGADASNFLVMANPNESESGFYKFSGICADNCGSGEAMAVAIVHLEAKQDLNIADFEYKLELKELSDTMGKQIKLFKL